MDVKLYSLARHPDERGSLVAVEAGTDIPFSIQRVYYIYGAASRRGFHAHKTLRQLLICVHGSCKVLVDDGREKRTVRLADPGKGLYIGEPVWREMFDFSPGAVLLVLASAAYDESDYIRDYQEFLTFVARGRQTDGEVFQ